MENRNTNSLTEQLHRVINDPDIPEETRDALRTEIYADVINTITSHNFPWTDRRVICELWPLVRDLAQTAIRK
jgi:hypothetical protein